MITFQIDKHIATIANNLRWVEHLVLCFICDYKLDFQAIDLKTIWLARGTLL